MAEDLQREVGSLRAELGSIREMMREMAHQLHKKKPRRDETDTESSEYEDTDVEESSQASSRRRTASPT